MFLLIALNNFHVLAGDVGHDFLNAPCKEIIYVQIGQEIFRPENEGNRAYIVRSMCGLFLTGKAWREILVNIIKSKLWTMITSYQ